MILISGSEETLSQISSEVDKDVWVGGLVLINDENADS